MKPGVVVKVDRFTRVLFFLFTLLLVAIPWLSCTSTLAYVRDESVSVCAAAVHLVRDRKSVV